MEGYEVVTVDGKWSGIRRLPDRRAGRASQVQDALPREFAHVDDSGTGASTVPKEIVSNRRRSTTGSTSGGCGALRPPPRGPAPRAREMPRPTERNAHASRGRRAVAFRNRRRRCSGTAAGIDERIRKSARRWKPPRASAASRSSRLVCSSSHESVTWPIRFAFACSRPGWSRSVAASRPTQRSQRTPVTWSVSVWTDTLLT